jgi:hypothetical protein
MRLTKSRIDEFDRFWTIDEMHVGMRSTPGKNSVALLVGYGRSFYWLLGNRRKFDRVPFSGNIRATCKGGGLITKHVCSCVDISPSGIGIDCPELMLRDAVVQLSSDEEDSGRFARVRY